MSTVAIGSFDGIHLGHAAVVGSALANDPGASIVCFEPVPRQYFGGEGWCRRLTTPWERRVALRALGVESIITLPFDDDTVGTLPEAFLGSLLDRHPFRTIVAGYDFHFGAERSGTCDGLRKWCTSMGISAIIEPPLSIGGAPVKSERIRSLLECGELDECRDLLGRRYSVSGPVSRGRGVGRNLGFPTLNLRVPSCKMLPPPGSYACRADLENEGNGIPAAVFVPRNATGPVEAHLLEQVGETYGRSVTVRFVSRLRDVADVPDASELSKLIDGDVALARKILDS